MIANWLKILLFAAGGTTAALVTAYVVGLMDPYLERAETPPPVAEAADPESPSATSRDMASAPAGETSVSSGETSAPAGEASISSGETSAPAGETSISSGETSDRVAASPSGEDAGPAAPPLDDAAAAATDAAAEVATLAPKFDLLRVEPNGSMVIAGRAAANAEIEIVAGADVIARTTAGAGGDFAAVLDENLSPGDYQIVLRSTEPRDAVVATSVETAVVSVPDSGGGQVLALVEQPGVPSRLITVPEPESGETTARPPREGQEEQAAPSAPDAPAQGATLPQPSDESAADAAAPSLPAGEEPGETAAAPAAPVQSAPPATLAVEAIEIEGRSVFVAGRAEPQSTLRVYANELLLGEARATENGRFLVETQIELPVGDYIVRADRIDSSGEVAQRAAVPFEREPGETIAAIAPAQRTVAPEAPPAGEAQAPAAEMPASPEPDEVPAAREAPAADMEAAPSAGEDAGSSAPEPAASAAADRAARPLVHADETLAPPLEAVDGSVIIRRGDSLWRISRRVYGRGVRYSTIYLANQDQISDPDLIWPGQIFTVPDETDQGERADFSTIADQVAPPDGGAR